MKITDRYHSYKRLLLLIPFIWVVEALAQDISFNYLSTDDGLSQFTVYSLHKDELGRIWIGTRDGLNVYDGNQIQSYKPDREDEHSMLGKEIRKVCGDDKGMLYIQSTEGVCSYDMATEKFHAIWKNQAHAITYFSDTLFIGGKGVVYSYDAATRRMETYVSLKESALITSILKDRTGKLWIGTRGQGLYRLDEEKRLTCVLPQGYVYNMRLDAAGDVWVCTWEDGLYCISSSGRISHFTDKTADKSLCLSSNSVRDCIEDNQGNLWIATFNGLDKYDKKKNEITYYSSSDVPGSLSNPSVYCLLKDHQGTIWLGTYFGGVNYFNPEYEIYTHYRPGKHENEGLSFPVIGCFTEDNKGNLWIATEGGGLDFYDRKSKRFKWYQHFEGKHSLSHNNIKSLYYDEKREAVWIGTHQEGINRLDLKTDKITGYKIPALDGIPLSNVILDIIPYKDDLLLASYDGVFTFNPETEKFTRLLDLFSHHLMIDSQGVLWVCVEGKGVFAYHFDTKELVNYQYVPKQANGLSDNMVTCITEDRHQNLWFSTISSGLDVFYRATGKFENFNSKKNGLDSDCIYSLVESLNGKLLLTTNRGFTIFDYYTKVFYNYNNENGFPFTTLNENSLYQCKDGEIFLGGIKGMISFYEKNLNIPPKPYDIIPVKLWINAKEVSVGDETGILNTSLYKTSSITLKSNHSVLNLEFAVSNYIAANQHEFVYKLDGFSNEWTKTHKQRIITYTNLSPGEYTLIVKTAGINNVYQPEYRLHIKVLPPFYKTVWAYLIYVVIAFCLLYYVVRTYHGRIKLQESLKYEKQHIRDVEELNQSKLRFFTNISHEFRTPLTIIIGQIEMLLQVQSFPPAIYNKLLNIYKNGLQLRELISELLDFRKQEQGHMKIKVSKHNLVDFIYENYLLYVEYAATRQVNFHFNKDPEQIEVWYDPRQMQKVINNLLSNAFKYTPEGGNVSIRVGSTSDEAFVSVQNTGKGIQPEEIEKIFERFYQVDNSSKSNQGTGIGLALSKGIVELHQGRIEVSSDPENGTIFTITLKLGNAHYSPEQIEATDERQKTAEAVIAAEPAFTAEQQVIDDAVKERIKGAKVLIVEDNDSLRDMLAGLFEPYYEVVTASNGEEGGVKAREILPDLIVSDVVMPKMTGVELCKQVKQDFETCHIPVVLLTARTAIEHTIEGLRIGADDYITKPFNVSLLLSRCNNLVNSRIVLQEKFSKQPQTRVQMLATNPMDKELLDRAVDIIEKNMDNVEFSLNDVIRELGISRTNFFSKMKAITGQTPNDFILTIRLKKAAYLLKNESFLSVADVADRTGFSSPRYFSRCFKDVYGISPLFYRSGNKEADSEETGKES